LEKQGKFTLYSLADFAAYLKDLKVSFNRKITHIQEHHTLIPDYGDFNGSNHFARLKAMETYHIEQGFGQIAQHFTIFPDGLIASGRPLSLTPTCIKGHNTGGICIENLGDFDIGKDKMTEDQKYVIVNATALLCNKFNLPVNTTSVVYHHWFRQSDGVRDEAEGKLIAADHKTCPGTNFFGGNRVTDANAHFISEVFDAWEQLSATEKARIITSVLNIRSGAGTVFSVVGQLKQNEEVSVLERKDGWIRIRKDQWVFGQYLITV